MLLQTKNLSFDAFNEYKKNIYFVLEFKLKSENIVWLLFLADWLVHF